MIGCIVQTRMGSTRLPGKVLEKLDSNYTMLEYVLKQLSHSKHIEKIVVATTINPEDDKIEHLVRSLDVNVFRGDIDDVLSRFYSCAQKFGMDTIVRVNSDCPLSDPDIIDNMIERFRKGMDFLCNYKPRTFPYGMDVEIFSYSTLEKAWKNASLASEREHVSPYIYNRPELFNNENYENDEDYSNIRIVVDREKDIELIRSLVEIIKDRPIKLNNVLDIFQKEPKIFSINQDYHTYEGYLRSVENDNGNNVYYKK